MQNAKIKLQNIGVCYRKRLLKKEAREAKQ
jgi:hypothetical protein